MKSVACRSSLLSRSACGGSGSARRITGWAALLASRRVLAAGIERVSSLLSTALAEGSVRERFANLGVHPEPSTAAQLRDVIRAETTRWGDVVRSQGIRLE